MGRVENSLRVIVTAAIIAGCGGQTVSPQDIAKAMEIGNTPITSFPPVDRSTPTTTLVPRVITDEPTETIPHQPTRVFPSRTPTETPTPIPTRTPTETPPTATEISPTSIKTEIPPEIPSLDTFIKECIKEGEVDVSGIYADGIFAIHLVRGEIDDVPEQKGIAEVWNDAWENGKIIAILAHVRWDHEILEGQKFYNLTQGGIIYFILTDGTVERYGISEKKMWRYEEEKKFLSPWEGGDKIPVSDLANSYYRGGNNFDRMVLQTCIVDDTGEIGVLIVIAYRAK
jgi:hypothetical protein